METQKYTPYKPREAMATPEFTENYRTKAPESGKTTKRMQWDLSDPSSRRRDITATKEVWILQNPTLS